MPLIGKRLKPKDLKTLSLTLAQRGAEPVPMCRANQIRIIFWRPAALPTNFLRVLPTAPKMGGRRGPRCLSCRLVAVRRSPDISGHCANKALATGLNSVGARPGGQKRIFDCPIRPLRGRDRCPLKGPAL